MKYLILAIILSGCAVLDSIGDTSRTDSVSVRAAVQLATTATVAAKCYPRPALACFDDGVIYVQGDPLTPLVIMKLTVQYLSWADLGDKCGRVRGNPSCYANGTLYTSSNYGIRDDKNNGAVGDILAEAMGLKIGLNRRTQLGHEFQHLLGASDPDWVEGSKHLGSFW